MKCVSFWFNFDQNMCFTGGFEFLSLCSVLLLYGLFICVCIYFCLYFASMILFESVFGFYDFGF